MRSILALAVLSTSALSEDLTGTCVGGTDPMGLEQTCFARCHVYSKGLQWHGGCNNYAMTPTDIDGPCGDSPQNACVATFNALWDLGNTNCGNCYYVEMRYADGMVTSTYLKAVDMKPSDSKFEMSGPAWDALCPFVCVDTGNCARDASACPRGTVQPVDTFRGPISCVAPRHQITFKRTDCDGPPVPPSQNSFADQSRPSPIEECSASVGHPTNPNWSAGCKDLCAHYGQSAAACPGKDSAEGLISCILSGATYCQRV